MNKNDICVIIPIYKTDLNDFEIQSVKQCIKVLSNYSIHFVVSNTLNTDFYRNTFPEITNYVYFDQSYFHSITGYNKLLLSVIFYKSFEKYNYMLIYQTDCYVFRDELLDWAKKEYDYVGGIWFENYIGNPYQGAKIWCAGNGGLSLRNTKKIIELLSSKARVKGLSKLFSETKRLKKFGFMSYIKGLVVLPFRYLGYKNNFSYKAEIFTENEDAFFTQAGLVYNKIKVPNAEDVLDFSWDTHPSFLYDKLGKLPFACHAWYREDALYEGNKEFWLKHIKEV